MTGGKWWDRHSARTAAALQWYTDPHSQVLFTVFLSLSHRLVISLASSLVDGVFTAVDGLPGMQRGSFNPCPPPVRCEHGRT